VALYNCALLAGINGVLLATRPSYVLTTVIKGVTLNLGCIAFGALLFGPKWLQIRSSKNGDEPPLEIAALGKGSNRSALTHSSEFQLPGAGGGRAVQQPKSSPGKKLPFAQLYAVRASGAAAEGESLAPAAAAAAHGEHNDGFAGTLPARKSMPYTPGASPVGGGSPLYATSPGALGLVGDEREERSLSKRVQSPSAWKGKASPERSPRSL
jgi:hypothetical protein